METTEALKCIAEAETAEETRGTRGRERWREGGES